MPQQHLTQRVVDRLPAPTQTGKDVLHWCSELKGFGIRCSGKTNTKMYIAQRDIEGKARRVNIGACNELSLEAARRAAADVLLSMRAGVDPKHKIKVPTLQSTLDGYLANNKNLRPASRRMYRQIERWLQPWMQMPLAKISSDMVEARHRELVGTNPHYKGEASANYSMRVVGILWNYAADRHADLPQNPVRRLRRGGMYAVPRRTRKVDVTQLPAFWQAVQSLNNPIVADWLTLMLFTGMRRREAATLRWDDVSFTDQVIRLPATATKAKRELVLPMCDVVRDMLVARRRIGNADGFVFPGRGRSPHLTGNVRTFDVIAAATGIRISAHDLRRTWASCAGECPISPFALKAMLNHATGDVTGAYVIISLPALREAVQLVADRMKALCGIAEPVGKNVRKMANKLSL